MRTLAVFDHKLAQQMNAAGLKPINTQFDIKQTEVWLFAMSDARPLCFDIEDAIASGKCKFVNQFKMTF